MKAKEFILVLTGAAFCLTTTAWAKDDLPTTEEFAHYQPMLQRSPFAVATAGALPNTPDFAQEPLRGQCGPFDRGRLRHPRFDDRQEHKGIPEHEGNGPRLFHFQHPVVGPGGRNQGHDHEGRPVCDLDLQRSVA